jgi:hypothetical protein
MHVSSWLGEFLPTTSPQQCGKRRRKLTKRLRSHNSLIAAKAQPVSPFVVAMRESHDFSIKSFATSQRFVRITERRRSYPSEPFVRAAYLDEVRQRGQSSPFRIRYVVPADQSEQDDIVAILRQLSDKIGELGSYWCHEPNAMFDFKYAKVKLGDLFEFYTTSDGELRFPPWDSFKFVVDEYLEAEAVRTKYHPSRVQQFIDTNGLEQLELME